MISESLKHDVAWAGAISILEVFVNLIREEEQPDAFREIYDRVKASLEAFEIQSNRLERRMKPGVN